jgi:hypothetical protein
MRLDTIHKTVNGKTYTSYLLRQAYRDHGKVRHKTIANLSKCKPEEIRAISLALKHKGDLSQLGSLREEVQVRQGLSVGAVFTLSTLANRLGITRALGNTQQAKRALWQVIARVIDQGSRLSAVRLAASHAACDVLGLKPFDEDDLYANLDWLSENQTVIEDRLFRSGHPDGTAGLFLYDVTSSYLEGTGNELGAFGYNRDGKRGKQQIVIGLLCDSAGQPLSVEVFEGQTSDTSTFASQVRKVADRFGGGEVTLVGDRGMIKGPQIEALGAQEDRLHYITAITKPQIETLLRRGVFQLELFDEPLAEVTDSEDGVRYVLRRNPLRAGELAQTRRDKQQAVEQLVCDQNRYLAEHSRARVHQRYKSLSQVEWAFRTSKTTHLEVRPIYVRKESRTRAHVFVVMLAYLIVKELTGCWRELETTVEEALQELGSLCMNVVTIPNETTIHQVPAPREMVSHLLSAAAVEIPPALPYSGARVYTKKKLAAERQPA